MPEDEEYFLNLVVQKSQHDKALFKGIFQTFHNMWEFENKVDEM